MVAYRPAFGFFGDTFTYLKTAEVATPNQIWPVGYPLFLKAFAFTGHIITVSAVQHLIGLAMGAGVYALLVHRGVSRKLSALAAAPVLLDARQIILEHYILTETLFTGLLLAALLFLLWRERPAVWMCTLAGLTFAAAALTRTAGQPLAVIVVVYLVVRRVGWRQVTAFTGALVVPLVAYLVWYHEHHGVYAFNQMSGHYMWQRTTTFVDCSKNGFTAEELKLCPREPVGQREVNDLYLFTGDRHRLADQFRAYPDDPIFGSFARKAILGQPVDFLTTIARDGIHLVQPGWQAPPTIACRTDQMSMVSGTRASGQTTGVCSPALMAGRFYPEKWYEGGYAAQKVTALNGGLWAYGRTFTVWPLALVLMAVFAIVTACWRPRRLRPRDAADAFLLSALGLTTILLSLALSVIDVRFTVPLLTIVPPAAVLAWHRLRSRSTTGGDDSGKAPVAG
jgi:hypothetical protein